MDYNEPRGERAVLKDIDAVLFDRQNTLLRHAVLDVLAAGDLESDTYWCAGFSHPFSTVAQDSKDRFAAAVVKRFRELTA